MKNFNVSDVVAITEGEWISKSQDYQIRDFSTDSRIISSGELFIALKGTKYDGNEFAGEALSKGALGAVVSKYDRLQSGQTGNVILVQDTVDAIQKLSKAYRSMFSVKAIGVTGSTGKTIVKDMLTNILNYSFVVHATPMSFHGQIGLPLTLLSLKPDAQVLVLELGISRKGEMKKLAQMAGLDCAILTNISETHLEHLDTMDTVAREKSYIFQGFESNEKLAILNGDDDRCRAIADSLACRIQTFGLSERADYKATHITPAGSKGYWFTLEYPDGKTRLYLNAPGKHNIYNALAAIAGAKAMGADDISIKKGLEEFHLPQMRLEIHTSSVLEENVTIINDTYNASPASMQGALAALREMSGKNRCMAILGDMLELGNFSVTAHEKLVPKSIVTRSIFWLLLEQWLIILVAKPGNWE